MSKAPRTQSPSKPALLFGLRDRMNRASTKPHQCPARPLNGRWPQYWLYPLRHESPQCGGPHGTRLLRFSAGAFHGTKHAAGQDISRKLRQQLTVARIHGYIPNACHNICSISCNMFPFTKQSLRLISYIQCYRITLGLSAIKSPLSGSKRLRNWASVSWLNTSTPDGLTWLSLESA